MEPMIDFAAGHAAVTRFADGHMNVEDEEKD